MTVESIFVVSSDQSTSTFSLTIKKLFTYYAFNIYLYFIESFVIFFFTKL